MPILTLILITPVLTELLSGNTPAPVFFLPWIYGPLILVYGIPVVLARELFIRWRLGLPGLFLLGLAYGIFNEGVVAKTLLMNEHVPMSTFDHHAWMGLNFPWAAMIVPWHACHAIIFPIALVSWWFPEKARLPSLAPWVFWLLAAMVSVLGAMAYLGNKEKVTSPIYLVIFVAAIAGLIEASRLIKQGLPFLESAQTESPWPAAAGFSFYPVFVLGPTILAGLKAPGLVIIAGAFIILALYHRLLVRHGWLGRSPFMLFALGSYLAGSFFTGLIMLAKHNLPGVFSEFLLMIAFAVSGIKVVKRNYSRAAS